MMRERVSPMSARCEQSVTFDGPASQVAAGPGAEGEYRAGVPSHIFLGRRGE